MSNKSGLIPLRELADVTGFSVTFIRFEADRLKVDRWPIPIGKQGRPPIGVDEAGARRLALSLRLRRQLGLRGPRLDMVCQLVNAPEHARRVGRSVAVNGTGSWRDAATGQLFLFVPDVHPPGRKQRRKGHA